MENKFQHLLIPDNLLKNVFHKVFLRWKHSRSQVAKGPRSYGTVSRNCTNFSPLSPYLLAVEEIVSHTFQRHKELSSSQFSHLYGALLNYLQFCIVNILSGKFIWKCGVTLRHIVAVRCQILTAGRGKEVKDRKPLNRPGRAAITSYEIWYPNKAANNGKLSAVFLLQNRIYFAKSVSGYRSRAQSS